jgi:hypothetical protein
MNPATASPDPRVPRTFASHAPTKRSRGINLFLSFSLSSLAVPSLPLFPYPRTLSRQFNGCENSTLWGFVSRTWRRPLAPATRIAVATASRRDERPSDTACRTFSTRNCAGSWQPAIGSSSRRMGRPSRRSLHCQTRQTRQTLRYLGPRLYPQPARTLGAGPSQKPLTVPRSTRCPASI